MTAYNDFIVNVGPGGTFLPSGNYNTLPEHIDELFARFEQSSSKKITLYFHGGLVNERRGLETAYKMASHIKEAGNEPVCFVWETGLVETVTSNLSKISETSLFQKLIRILIKKLSEKIGLQTNEGRGMNTSFSIEEIDDELAKEHPFQNYSKSLNTSVSRGGTILSVLPKDESRFLALLEAEYAYVVESDFELVKVISETKLTTETNEFAQSRGVLSVGLFVKHLAKITYRVIKRFYQKRDHNFYPTVIEELLRELYISELGAWVWSNMKVKSEDMWRSNSGKKGNHRFAGRYFLDKLIEYAELHNDVEINLIGHSAGSIAICNLLKTIASIKPELTINKIVFMAPACRTDLFLNEIVQQPQRYRKFRMYTMSDGFETQDRLVPFVYTHSLLYFISGALENEGKDYDAYLLGLERHILAQEPYNIPALLDINEYLFEQDNIRIVLSHTAVDAILGFQSLSSKHGAFDDDVLTINSIKHFIAEA